MFWLNLLTQILQSIIIQIFLEDISEKIIMNSIEMQNFCKKEVDSTIDRMHILCAEGRSKDAQALYNEIRDWVVKKKWHWSTVFRLLGIHFRWFLTNPK